MELVESRLLGVQVDEKGREVLLSIIDASGAKCVLALHGVERLLVNELRQQNVIEEMRHWTLGGEGPGLREAAFYLMTGVAESECGPQLTTVACSVIDRVIQGDLEMMEITAVFGAQVLALFVSMTVRSEA